MKKGVLAILIVVFAFVFFALKITGGTQEQSIPNDESTVSEPSENRYQGSRRGSFD